MLEDANRDIQRLCQEDLRRRWREQRLDRVVHAIDDLLFQLEDLNLLGVDRVPAGLRERAGSILDAVPNRERYETLRVRYRVVPLMDVLFRAQEVLFHLRDLGRGTHEEREAEDRAAEPAVVAAPASLPVSCGPSPLAGEVARQGLRPLPPRGRGGPPGPEGALIQQAPSPTPPARGGRDW